MDKDILIELIRLLPTLLLIFVIILLLLIYRAQISELISRIGSVKAFGVEAEFQQAKQQLRQATASYNIINVPEEKLTRIINRAERLAPILNEARILWVDDNFYSNATIVQFLEAYKIKIDDVETTAKALEVLQWASAAYDVIVSDMVRGNEQSAAYNLIDGMLQLNPPVRKPVIIFVGNLNNTPVQYPDIVMGITNDPTKLINMIMDAIEHSDRRTR